MPSLLEILGMAGNALDLPGSSVRDLFKLRNPLDQWRTPFSDENRTSGRELAEAMGLTGAAAGVGGFGAEMLLDPTNLIGGGLLAKLFGKAAKAKAANRGIEAANALSLEQRAAGFMPEEIAELTKIVDETGQPKRLYHGTHEAFDSFSPTSSGIFFSPDARYASAYASPQALRRRLLEGDVVPDPAPNVRMAYIDSRNPMQAGLDGMSHIDAPSRLKDRGFDAAVSSSGDEVTAFGPSQVYLPYVAKRLQQRRKVPRAQKPLAAAITAHNAAARSPYKHPGDVP